MSVRSSGTTSPSRSSVFTRRGLSFTSGRSCFGRWGVLRGQNREPTPPARITAHLVIFGGRGFVICDAGEMCDFRVQLLRAEGLRQEISSAAFTCVALVVFLAGSC